MDRFKVINLLWVETQYEMHLQVSTTLHKRASFISPAEKCQQKKSVFYMKMS
jgi:hypothetical protein